MTTRLRRLAQTPEHRTLALLALLALGLTGLIAFTPLVLTMGWLMLPMLLAHFYLHPRRIPWFVGSVLLLALLGGVIAEDRVVRESLALLVTAAVGAGVVLSARHRARLGIAGVRGESMLVDLRDRLQQQGEIPTLPRPWLVETALSSAEGTPFAGDFFVASQPRPERLEIALVDVSGKGQTAASRALMLSGAFGGLLGALPPDRFLPAANEFLLRQEWREGFATAVHLSLDLESGYFEVRTAGHPPALFRDAGCGRWQVLGTGGPLLGMMPVTDFEPRWGTLRAGDGLMLYTDGMVERRSADIGLGIDRLLGAAEQISRGEFAGLAGRLVEVVGAADDDRTMLVLSRAAGCRGDRPERPGAGAARLGNGVPAVAPWGRTSAHARTPERAQDSMRM